MIFSIRGPVDDPDIPVYLAGVNPRMAVAAGETADGFNVHPMHSPEYLREIIHPALAEGVQRRGRSVRSIELLASCFVVRGATESERRRSERAVRQQIAFYASTPSYRTFLEFHGEMDIAKRLSALMRERRFEEMPDLVSDNLLCAVAVSEADGELAQSLRAPLRGEPGPAVDAVRGRAAGSRRTALAYACDIGPKLNLAFRAMRCPCPPPARGARE